MVASGYAESVGGACDIMRKRSIETDCCFEVMNECYDLSSKGFDAIALAQKN